MNIRKARLEDVKGIVMLENKVFKQSLGPDFLVQELTDNPFAYYVVGEMNRHIIAYLGLRIVTPAAEMMNVAVDPEYQRQGRGSKLLEYALDFVMRQGVKHITLEVRKSNTAAQAFYIKHGFERSHIRKHYYESEDAVVLSKEI